MSSGGYKKAFLCFSKDVGDFVGFLGAVGLPSPFVPLAFVFSVFCGGFQGGPPKPPYQPLGWSYGYFRISRRQPRYLSPGT